MKYTVVRNYIFLIPMPLKVAALFDFVHIIGSQPKILSTLSLNKLRVLKRFIGGWYLGYQIGQMYELKAKTSRLYARLFACWILAVISLDDLIDSHKSDVKNSDDIINIIKLILITPQKKSFNINEPQHYAIQKKNQVIALFYHLRNLCELLNTKLPLNLDHFNHYAEQLLEGEKQSTLQKITKDNINFERYLKTILPIKTYPLLLTPVALLCKHDDLKFKEFKSDLEKLDRACNFWQVQDDIGDLEKDLADGILASPTLCLLEQCKLAKGIAKGQITHSEQLLKLVSKTGILDVVSNRELNTNDFFALSKFILSNSKTDNSLTFSELIRKYSELYTEIDSQLFLKNYIALYFIVAKNGVSERLLADINTFDHILSELKGKDKNAILFIGTLMRNAIIKAKNQCYENRHFIS